MSPSLPAADAAARAATSISVSKACPIVYGAETDPRSLRVGAVFDLSGADAELGAMQVRSGELAVAQLNAAGGVSLRAETDARPITLIACDGAAGVRDVVSRLVELDVKAIIGPSQSQLYSDLAAEPALPRDALLLGLTSLPDATRTGLTLGMTPSEAERVPLLVAQLRALETFHGRRIVAALVLRTGGALTQPLIAAAGMPPTVAYEYVDPTADLPAIIASLTAQPPDVILTDGATEIVAPLEAAFSAGAARPDYVLTEAAQGPQLLSLTEANPALQPRLSLVAAASSASAAEVYTAFARAYSERHGESPRAVSSVAASYAAVYALAFGLIAAEQPFRFGETLADGLRQLSGGDLQLRTLPPDISAASAALRARRGVTVTSPLGELAWNDQGALQRGVLAVYCVASVEGRWSFVSSGYSYDAATRTPTGEAVRCADITARLPVSPGDADGGVEDAGDVTPDAGTASEPEPPAAPQPTDIGLTVQYHPLNVDPHDNIVSPALKIVNRRAAMPVPLCSLTLRYYFTNEHADVCQRGCVLDTFYTGVQPSGRAIDARRAYRMPPAMQSQAHIEITFPCTAPSLAMGDSVELLQQFHTEPYSDFDETDDYSFRPGPMTFVDWDRVTLHHDGTLVWGLPPH